MKKNNFQQIAIFGIALFTGFAAGGAFFIGHEKQAIIYGIISAGMFAVLALTEDK